jgi:hypothetical protein
MPENIKCGVCSKVIHVKNFKDQMKKLRKHYRKEHPTNFKQWGKKAAATRKRNKKDRR